MMQKPTESSSEFPKARYYGKGDPIHVSAQQIWMILVAFIESKRKELGKTPPLITYGQVVEAMGLAPNAGRTIARQLGVIAEFCAANKLPLLNTIVVRKDDQQPGIGVITTGDLLRDQKKVHRQDWMSIRIPTTGEFRRTREASLALQV